MESTKYINECGSVEMSQEEFDNLIVQATQKGYDSGRSDSEKELKVMREKLDDVSKDNLFLQVQHDQLLRAAKELAMCLQYETGIGFLK